MARIILEQLNMLCHVSVDVLVFVDLSFFVWLTENQCDTLQGQKVKDHHSIIHLTCLLTSAV